MLFARLKSAVAWVKLKLWQAWRGKVYVQAIQGFESLRVTTQAALQALSDCQEAGLVHKKNLGTIVACLLVQNGQPILLPRDLVDSIYAKTEDFPFRWENTHDGFLKLELSEPARHTSTNDAAI